MKTVLTSFVVLWIAGASCSTFAVGPVQLTPMDDPRIAQFAAALEAGSGPSFGANKDGLLHQAIRAKGIQPAGTTRHPADEANSPTAAASWFGFSMAASDDYLVVGAPGFNPGSAAATGRAYLFRRFGPDLILEATLAANDGAADDWFGYAVEIEGDTVMVSANRDDISGHTQVGSVYVFERDGNTWPQVAKLFPASEMEDSNYGFSILIEGDRALVGAISSNPPMFPGALHRYQRISGVWTAQGLIEPADQQNAQWFGYSMAREGDELVVGAPLYDGPLQNTGRAVLFQRDNGNWVEFGQLQDPASTFQDWFAGDLQISDGVIAASAFSRDHNGIVDAGAVCIFRKLGGFWAPLPETTLTAPTPQQANNFGWSIGLDHGAMWVGMPGAFPVPILFSYRDNGTQWLPTAQYSPPQTPNFSGLFGGDIEVADDALFVSAERAQGQTTNLPNVGQIHSFFRTALITPQAGAGGQLLPSMPTEHMSGHPISVFVNPNPGYRIVSVTGCNGLLVGQSYQFIVRNDCTVTASFANDAPQATAIQAQPGVYEGEVFNVTLTATDPESAPLSYSFDCDGNGSFELGPQASNVGACVVAAAGDYTAVARATDLGGLEASLGINVSVANSQPIVSLSPPIAADEDQDFFVTTTASVPSSGEQITVVSIDCNYDGVTFDADVTASAPGQLLCPGHGTAGVLTIAARATDNEGEHSALQAQNMTVLAVNDPPTFTLAGNQQRGPAATGTFNVANFVDNVSVGPPDEQGQQIISISVSTVSNPDGMVTQIDIAPDRTLSFTLNGLAGTAQFGVALTDSGGIPGEPSSAFQYFTITNTPGTDLQVSIDDLRTGVLPGDIVTYEVLAGNAGPNSAVAVLHVDIPQGTANQTWTCEVISNANCPFPTTGVDTINAPLSLSVGGIVRFTVTNQVTASPGAFIAATATLTASDSNAEIDSSDNTATDSNPVVTIGIFKDGFEVTGGNLKMLADD